MREFYSATSFPSQIWNVNLLKRPEVYEKILNKPHSKISTNFSVAISQFNNNMLRLLYGLNFELINYLIIKR